VLAVCTISQKSTQLGFAVPARRNSIGPQYPAGTPKNHSVRRSDRRQEKTRRVKTLSRIFYVRTHLFVFILTAAHKQFYLPVRELKSAARTVFAAQYAGDHIVQDLFYLLVIYLVPRLAVSASFAKPRIFGRQISFQAVI